MTLAIQTEFPINSFSVIDFNKVGRIIGKGGQNVRELQRVTGSIIKLPEHGTAPADEETTVHIIGPFFSVQVKKHFANDLMYGEKAHTL